MIHIKHPSAIPPFSIQAFDLATGACLSSSYLHPQAFRIIWICDGSGSHSIDFKKFDASAQMIFCIRPGQLHELSATAVMRGYILSFTDVFFSESMEGDSLASRNGLLAAFPGNSCLVLNDLASHELTPVIDKMMMEFENDHLYRMEMLRRYLTIFLVYLSRQSEASFREIIRDRNIELTQQFHTLLNKHFGTRKLVSEYAALLFVTPNYLNTVIKKLTGYSVRYHIRQRVILEAKRKAAYSGVGMKEIAYQLGFVDTSHFSKYFKSATGINFSEFRKERYLMVIAE